MSIDVWKMGRTFDKLIKIYCRLYNRSRFWSRMDLHRSSRSRLKENLERKQTGWRKDSRKRLKWDYWFWNMCIITCIKYLKKSSDACFCWNDWAKCSMIWPVTTAMQIIDKIRTKLEIDLRRKSSWRCRNRLIVSEHAHCSLCKL